MQSTVENEVAVHEKKMMEAESIKKTDKKRKSRKTITKNKNQNGNNPIVKMEFINTNVWESLHEVYDVAKDIKRSLKSNSQNQQKMSFEALVDYILDVFQLTKKKFLLTSSGQIETTNYCSCFYYERTFYCSSGCSEEQYMFMLAHPVYTLYSNSDHFTENGNKNCDGSFDPPSLSDYIKTLFPPKKKDSKKASNVVNIEDIMKITKERDIVNAELREANKKIAVLNSRLNILESKVSFHAREQAHKRR